MKRNPYHGPMLWVVLLLVGLSMNAIAKAEPKALKGKIITNARELKIPQSAKNFVKKMLSQDRNQFRKDANGQWRVYFLAFFNRKLPDDQIGIVVLDAKNEPVAVANVTAQRGQTTLASQITVESTETPGKPHTLQVYFAKQGKPVVLAKKQILLK